MSVLTESRSEINSFQIGPYEPVLFGSVEVPQEISDFLATIDQGEFSSREPGSDLDPAQGMVPYKQLHETFNRQLRSIKSGSWLAKKPARVRFMWLNEGWVKEAQTSYLEHIGCKGEDQLTSDDKYLISLNEIKRTISCGKAYMSFLGRESREISYGRLHCEKQYCPICGGKGGRVHKRRKQSVYKSLQGVFGTSSFTAMKASLNEIFLRQLVFTVPEEKRSLYFSKRGVEQLIQAAKKVAEEFFGAPVISESGKPKTKSGQVVYSFSAADKQAVVYLHLFSEDQPEKFNPHVNIHIFEKKGIGEQFIISPEKLEAIRARWLWALQHIGCKGIKVADVHYSFRSTPKKIMHAIKYMSRPLGRSIFDYWVEQDLRDFVTFMVYEMKGYSFIRKWGNMANAAVKDCLDLKAEMEERVGEKLDFVGLVSEFDIESMLKAGMLEDMGGGFYRRKRV